MAEYHLPSGELGKQPKCLEPESARNDAKGGGDKKGDRNTRKVVEAA